ncbi:MAG: hypothetical protein II388_01230 [Clostridia bacterium]|nr:hypothetical protein [Clostridia bacterium]
MASTMQAWRTGLSLTKAEMYAKINEFFPDIYEWDSVDTSVSNQTDYHLTDDLFIRATANGISAYSGGTQGGATSFSTYVNLAIYKVSSCIIICTNTSGNPLSQYAYTARIIIDTTESGTGYSIIYGFNSGYATIFDDSLSTAQNAYSPYNSYSLNTNSSTAQVAPYRNNLTGATFDNVYGVLFAPIMNVFVGFNNQKWLFTSGFALPAGDSEPTCTYV